MATQTAKGTGSFVNNGATILGAGNYSTGNITNDQTILANAVDDGYGSKVVQAVSPTSSGNLGTKQAVAGRPFAFQMTEGNFIMKRVTTTISGSGDTYLRSGAADEGLRQNPAVLETARTLGSGVTASWDYVTGALTKGGNAGGTMTFNSDHAARPTNAVPGELVYMITGATPTQDDYAPKTSF